MAIRIGNTQIPGGWVQQCGGFRKWVVSECISIREGYVMYRCEAAAQGDSWFKAHRFYLHYFFGTELHNIWLSFTNPEPPFDMP